MIAKDKYSYLNRSHTLEKLLENHQLKISKSTFNRWCNEEKILLKKIKRQNVKCRTKRPRSKGTGIMLQMDGSYHPWIYMQTACCLLIVIDDANSEIVWGEFVKHETTFDCMRAMKSIVSTKGRFDILYTDKAGVYGGKRAGFSQLDRALNEVGIQIIHAHSPEAKGRIERLFLTLQDRLVSEMRLFGINNINAANAYLKNIFLPQIYNKKFLLKEEIPSYYEEICTNNLNEVFCFKEYRKVKKDNTFSHKKIVYQLPKSYGNCNATFVEIRTYLDGVVKILYNGIEVSCFEYWNKAAA